MLVVSALFLPFSDEIVEAAVAEETKKAPETPAEVTQIATQLEVAMALQDELTSKVQQVAGSLQQKVGLVVMHFILWAAFSPHQVTQQFCGMHLIHSPGQSVCLVTCSLLHHAVSVPVSLTTKGRHIIQQLTYKHHLVCETYGLGHCSCSNHTYSQAMQQPWLHVDTAAGWLGWYQH